MDIILPTASTYLPPTIYLPSSKYLFWQSKKKVIKSNIVTLYVQRIFSSKKFLEFSSKSYTVT